MSCIAGSIALIILKNGQWGWQRQMSGGPQHVFMDFRAPIGRSPRRWPKVT
jgi:hypothetical protein